MSNVPIMHCFPTIYQEYVWETVGDYTVFKSLLWGLSTTYESVPSKKVKKKRGQMVKFRLMSSY